MKKLILYLILGVLIGAFSVLGFRRLQSHLQTIKAEKIELAHQKWVNQLQPDDFLLVDFQDRFTVSEVAPLLEYLNLKRQGKALACRGFKEERWKDFLVLFEQWPKGLKDYCERHVAEIHVVSNLGASGYVLQQTEGRFVIVLDSLAVEKRPNEWFRDKESTILELEGSGYSIEHRLEVDSNNLPEYTFETLMLHEIGHCIGVTFGQTRNFDIKTQPIMLNTLLDGVFNMQRVSFAMEPDLQPLFGNLRYYREKRITMDDYIKRLEALPLSPFPTIYSTVNDQEYFADYFYAHIHCIVQQRPLSYLVSLNSEPKLKIDCGITLPHHQKRRAIIAQIIRSMESEPESISKDFQ